MWIPAPLTLLNISSHIFVIKAKVVKYCLNVVIKNSASEEHALQLIQL